ncbi:unnamed protein product [Blepharisma stoltei]|uniref:Enoyl-CoA hydratase/isomerase family protein n=1 Tax=Blepharisma stoltei TaxID=1481888 RepID=A0AAU9IF38_9CILI|nr:unnamed protein product [Blepharisma stoltei]
MNAKRFATIAQHLCSAERLAIYQVISDSIAIITINRPSRLNSFNKDVWDQLNSFFRQAESDPNIKVIIITGVGFNERIDSVINNCE